MDLDTNIYLRVIEATYLLIFFTHTIIPPASLHLPGIDFSSHLGGRSWSGKTGQSLLLVIGELLAVTCPACC